MSISWGSYDGHLRVGIDHSISPSSPSSSDTSVTVTWKYYVGTDGWNFSDSQVLHENADGWGGADDSFSNNLSSGSMLVGTHQETYAIKYTSDGGSGSKGASANLTGAYNGATPSHSVSVALPDRPGGVPDAPSGLSHTSVTKTGFTANWTNGSGNGTSRDAVQLQVSESSSFSSTVYNNSALGPNVGSQAITGLDPGTGYYFRVRDHNSFGWGPWSGTNSLTTDPDVPNTPGTPTKSKSSDITLTLAWSAPSSNGGGTITYACDLATDSAFTSIVSTYTGTTNSHQFTGLTANTTYYARVKATNTVGSSGESGTLTTATLAAPSYDDSGDYVTLVNNLAAAVATKLAHLGTFICRGKNASTSLANNSVTYLNPGTSVETCNLPDPPTYASGSGDTITIQYPGTYLIEFAIGVPGSSANQALGMQITVNGIHQFSTTSGGSAGAASAAAWGANVHGDGQFLAIARRLAVGDTIGFSVYQSSGAAVSTTTIGTGDLYMWCRVTMIGF